MKLIFLLALLAANSSRSPNDSVLPIKRFFCRVRRLRLILFNLIGRPFEKSSLSSSTLSEFWRFLLRKQHTRSIHFAVSSRSPNSVFDSLFFCFLGFSANQKRGKSTCFYHACGHLCATEQWKHLNDKTVFKMFSMKTVLKRFSMAFYKRNQAWKIYLQP